MNRHESWRRLSSLTGKPELFSSAQMTFDVVTVNEVLSIFAYAPDKFSELQSSNRWVQVPFHGDCKVESLIRAERVLAIKKCVVRGRENINILALK